MEMEIPLRSKIPVFSHSMTRKAKCHLKKKKKLQNVFDRLIAGQQSPKPRNYCLLACCATYLEQLFIIRRATSIAKRSPFN